jgi:hypothetical protein
MSNQQDVPEWYSRFRQVAALDRAERGNIAAILVVLDRLKTEDALRKKISEIHAQVPNEVWRGWAALSLVVTPGEGQIALTGERVRNILSHFRIAANFVGRDGGRSSRGNFKYIRQLLGALPSDIGSLAQAVKEIEAAQADLINAHVMPALKDNKIKVRLAPDARPEAVIGELLKRASLRNATGGVAQHLVGAKLARRFYPAEIENFSVFSSDHQLNRPGDFLHGQEAFHVTVVAKPTAKLKERLQQNREARISPTILVLQKHCSAYESVAREFESRLRSIEQYVGDNLMEMGQHDREGMLREIRALIDTYNERVRAVERANSGLEIEIISV